MTVVMAPAELQEQAAAARRLAGLLTDVGEELRSRTRRLVWQGARVREFRRRLMGVYALLDGNADLLVQAAVLLDRGAEALDRRRAELLGAQRFVDALLVEPNIGPYRSQFLAELGWHGALPQPYDTAWDGLERGCVWELSRWRPPVGHL